MISILDSIYGNSLEHRLLSVSERYYKHGYCMDLFGISNVHQRVSFHLNRICLVSLAENHPIVKERKRINEVDCLQRDKKVAPDTILCYYNCVDGSRYPVFSCVKGKLIEINQEIKKRPNLLLEEPSTFIALILPGKKLSQEFLTRKQYFEHVEVV